MIPDVPTPIYDPHNNAKSRQVVHARPHNRTLRRLVKFSEFRPWRIIGPCEDLVVVVWGEYMLSSCTGSALYGRRDIRNHSDMFIILAVSL